METSAAPARPPVKHFATLPNLANAKLSPNGQQIGYITQMKGRKVLVMENVDATDRVLVPGTEKLDIIDFHWATDNRVLIVLEMSAQLRGYTTLISHTRLLAVDRDGSNIAAIVESEKEVEVGKLAATRPKDPPQFQHKILDLLPDVPDHILLSLDADHDGADEVRRIDINDGHFKIVRNDERGIQNWYLDHTGEIRFGSGYIEGTSTFTSSVKDANGEWLPLRKTEWADRYNFEGFSEDPNVIYVTGPGKYGTQGLFTLALDTGEIVSTVFEHESVDVDSIVLHPETRKPVGYRYTVDYPQVVYFDKTMQKVSSAINKVLPNTHNYIVGKARGAHTYMILAKSANDPGVYYRLDFKTKELKVIGAYMVDIKPEQTPSAKAVSIPMRDGSQIPAYLTTPKGMENAGNLPTVVLVHGGPWARDDAEWDWWSQFLASRGYAVLRPNYRGSTGYGNSFWAAGFLQWGGLMQDDVTDATKWLIQSGVAEKDHICIAGASYGGYAALMGAIKEPGLYACAASVNGVTDLPELRSSDKYNYLGRGGNFGKRMGLEGVSDSKISPVHRAEDISAPVLLMSAKDDTRIDYEMSEAMHKKLAKMGKKSRYVMIEDGGHNMDTSAARLTILTEMEKFLAENIGK